MIMMTFMGLALWLAEALLEGVFLGLGPTSDPTVCGEVEDEDESRCEMMIMMEWHPVHVSFGRHSAWLGASFVFVWEFAWGIN